MTIQYCEQTVFTDRFGGGSCANKAKLEHDGKWLCGVHSPEAVAKRKAKNDAYWKEEKARRDVQRTRARENQHKLATYDALLEALETLLNYSGLGQYSLNDTEIDKARDAVKAARA